MSELTDDDLMRAFRDGDVDAFDALFARHHASVYNFAAHLLRDADRAKDVLQETFLSVVRTRHEYRPRGRFRSWLLRICRNRCLNILEAEERTRRLTRDNGFLIVPSMAGPDSAEKGARNRALELVQREIAALPQRQREALLLYAFEGLRYREIAEVLDVPVNTVKTLIHRARRTLVRALLREEGTSDDLLCQRGRA